MGLGLALRRVSLPLCLLVGVLWGAWSLLHAITGLDQGFPNLVPFRAGARIGLATWLLLGVAALVALLVALRLLAITIGAVGWLLLPREHRDMLSRLSPPAQSGARSDPPESRDDMQQMRVACATGDSEPGW